MVLKDLCHQTRNHLHKIFNTKIWIKDRKTKKVLKIKEALDKVKEHYQEQFDQHPLVKNLFEISGRNASDFERIDRYLQSDSMRKAVERFKKSFQVAPQHSDELEALNLCMDYFLNFKILHFFCATPQANNPNRAMILNTLLEFFSSHLIMCENTRNEDFLCETIEYLIELPMIDVVVSQASIAPTYALSDIFTLAKLRSEQDLLDFEVKIDGVTIININHEYGYFTEMNLIHRNKKYKQFTGIIFFN